MILIALKEEEIKRFNELDDQIMTGCDLPEDLAREYVELKEKLEREYRFHNKRRWRFDWAWPAKKIAVEIDGGQWSPRGGRHNSDKDREKMNAAAVDGWRVVRFSGGMLKRDPLGCVQTVRRALEA